jgi:transcriptional regulator with XRE-family HTH domain
MTDKGLTEADLARESGLKQPVVNRFLLGLRDPSAGAARAFERVFNVPWPEFTRYGLSLSVDERRALLAIRRLQQHGGRYVQAALRDIDTVISLAEEAPGTCPVGPPRPAEAPKARGLSRKR